MDLADVRKNINVIDDSMKELFDKRLACSSQVASVKMDNNDEVYKPAREQEICQRFLEQGAHEYVCFVKKVMQISRKYQYNMFIDNDRADEDFIKGFYENIDNIVANDGILCLKLKADTTGNNGLDVKDILSVISDTTLEIKDISVKGDMVTVYFVVGENDICEACLVSYMLYKETLAV